MERSSTQEEVLKRNRKHQEWFLKTRDSDPALGTLAYLPYEIRQMVFTHALACRPTVSADGSWEYDHRLGSPFNVSAYYFGENGRAMIDHSISGLRLVSSPIKAEYEDVLLSKRTFRFNDPESLNAFIARLDSAQLDRVFSMAIGVCILHQMELWVKSVSQLPTNLKDAQFLIYTVFNDYFQPRLLHIFKEVVIAAARRAPNAEMSICGTGQQPLTPECLDFAHQFLQSPSTPRRLPCQAQEENIGCQQ